MTHRFHLVPVLALLSVLAGCGEGSKASDVVQAATREAAELGQQLADQAARLSERIAEMTPAEAKAKLQELVDASSRALEEIRDSETAQRIAAEIQRLIVKLDELATRLGEELDLAGLRDSVARMIERFENDPRVKGALQSLREKLDSLVK